MKLISGKMNVPYIILKPNYAIGAESLRPKRKKLVPRLTVFNQLELIYVVRQAQQKKAG